MWKGVLIASYCNRLFCVCGWRHTRVQETTHISVSLYTAPERSGTIINNLQASAEPSASSLAYFSWKCNWKRLVPNQPFSPFLFCWVYVLTNTTSILYFKSSAHTHTATSGVYHLTHTPGEHARRNVKLSDLNGVCFIHFAYCKSTQGFIKTLGLLQKSTKNFWGFLTSVWVSTCHHSYNKMEGLHSFFQKDAISRDCGNSRQVFTLHWVLAQGWTARLPHWKSNDIELCFRVIWKLNTFLRNCFCSDCQFSAWEVYDQIVSGRSFLLGSFNCWFSEDIC